MLVEYITAAGQEIKYDISAYGDYVTLEAINDIARMYAQLHPQILPDSVFMHVDVMTDFVKLLGSKVTIVSSSNWFRDCQFIAVHTGCGVLTAYPLPWGWQGPKVLVGTREDYNEYDIDKIFEKIVLKDCERE
jgi:hypothetical protein